jgi:hypothetical protein
METSGTALGESNTTGPGGCTNMAGAAAVSTGTLTTHFTPNIFYCAGDVTQRIMLVQ